MIRDDKNQDALDLLAECIRKGYAISIHDLELTPLHSERKIVLRPRYIQPTPEAIRAAAERIYSQCTPFQQSAKQADADRAYIVCVITELCNGS